MMRDSISYNKFTLLPNYNSDSENEESEEI